jgi:murein DD-endopeptidase MepM/ murein hydrolase activator NlpD
MGAEYNRILNRLFTIQRDLSTDVGSTPWLKQSGVLATMAVSLVGLGLLSMPATPQATPVPTPIAATEPASDITPDTLDTATTDPVPAVQSVAEAIVAPDPIDPEPLVKSITVGSGDTLADVLSNSGVERRPAHAAIQALSKNFNVRKLQVGQTVHLVLDGAEQNQLLELSLKPAVDKIVTTSRDEDGKFFSQLEIMPLQKVLLRASGRIDDSLYMSLTNSGVAPEIIADLIMVYSFDVDFQREIRAGDTFDVYYEQFQDDTGKAMKHGNILYGNLTLRGKPLDLYRYVSTDENKIDYYNEKGHSVRKALLRTPIDGARLTSRFGKRRHPVLGYTKMHKGADFGARRGTPIRAAGDGVVQRASRYGSFGNYVRIHHTGEYDTAYAHMKGFASGVRKGSTVKQGQIIGYVGTTGRSTGPHLHYEVLKSGKQVNPLGLKLPSGRRLDGPELVKYQAMLAERKVAIAETAITTQVAAKD